MEEKNPHLCHWGKEIKAHKICRWKGDNNVEIICGSCSDMGQKLDIIQKHFLDTEDKVSHGKKIEKKQESSKIYRWIVTFLQELFIEILLPIIVMIYCATVVYLLSYCLR
jgi:hypothetical protein